MILVVDGYNVLKNMVHSEHVPENQIKRFSRILEKYACRKGLKVVLVFDSGPCMYATREDKDHISIIFSGQRECADCVIKRYLSRNSHRELLLISSDNAIRSHASSCGVESVRASEFIKILNESFELPTEKQDGVAKKLHGSESNVALDDLMSSSDTRRARKSDDFESDLDRQSPSKTPSKKDKKLMQRLKKL